ncbi:MAG: hypothetical protein WC346_02210 [Methanogenium sp.]|jgi:hypothetical protein
MLKPTLEVNDVIRMIKPIPDYENLLGMKFRVTEVLEKPLPGGETIRIAYDQQAASYGGLSIAEFIKYFELVGAPRGWSCWYNSGWFKYRTDFRKYVQVRWDGQTATAQCHPTDVFDAEIGIALCIARLLRRRGFAIDRKQATNGSEKSTDTDDADITVVDCSFFGSDMF